MDGFMTLWTKMFPPKPPTVTLYIYMKSGAMITLNRVSSHSFSCENLRVTQDGKQEVSLHLLDWNEIEAVTSQAE
jgi:hypothetical protein